MTFIAGDLIIFKLRFHLDQKKNSAPNTSTKHAVSGLTRSGSLDGRKYDIAVGQIDIGNAATDVTVRMKTGTLQADGRGKLLVSEPEVVAVSRATSSALRADRLGCLTYSMKSLLETCSLALRRSSLSIPASETTRSRFDMASLIVE